MATHGVENVAILKKNQNCSFSYFKSIEKSYFKVVSLKLILPKFEPGCQKRKNNPFYKGQICAYV